MNDRIRPQNTSTVGPNGGADGNSITPLPGEPGIPQVTAARNTNWSLKGALGLGMAVLTLVLFAAFAMSKFVTSGPPADADSKLVRDRPSAASAGTRRLDMEIAPAPRVPALLPTNDVVEPIGVRRSGEVASSAGVPVPDLNFF